MDKKLISIMLMAVVLLLFMGNSETTALPSFTSTVVQITDMSNPPFEPPSPDPSGLAYLPSSNTLIMVDGEVDETNDGITHFEGVNVWEMTLEGSVIITTNISSVAPTLVPMTDEPTGVAWNPVNGHFYFTDDDLDRIFDLNPGTDEQIGTVDDSWIYFSLYASNINPQGVAIDPYAGVLFVADGISAEIFRYSTDGIYESSFDVEKYGIYSPESVEYNQESDTLFILGSPPNSLIIETTTSGILLRAIDFSIANIINPTGLAYAPASDSSGVKNFYILDQGLDTSSNPTVIDGRMVEMTAPDPITPENQLPVVDAGLDQTITLPANSVLLEGSVTDDGLPDPPGIITTTWSQGNGPCQVVFANTNAISTTAYFQYPGSYLIHLNADDGELTPIDETIITVERDPGVNAFDLLIADRADDAEEYAPGGVTIKSTDLELVYDGLDQQVVGLRYVGVDIPAETSITNAYIQFTVDEIDSEETSLIIQGEDIDQAPKFERLNGNISSRTKTTAAVSWNPDPWLTVGESGPDQRTPNIAAIIQEIIERPGWESGNPLAFIITGTGTRTAVAYDGDYCGAALLHIEFIEGENTPPTAVDDAYTTDEDVILIQAAPGILGNDSDVDGSPLTAVLDSAPTSGTLVLESDGSFEYTPNPNFYGTDSFTYAANDGLANSSIATVTITVDPVDDAPPVAVNDAYTTDEDVTLNVVAPGVLGNDYDVDFDPLTASLGLGPNHGTLTLNSDGSFQYIPDADFYGTDYFIYKANDGTADSNLAAVTITVNSVNDGGPVAVNDDYTTDEDVTLNVVAPGVLDNDTDVDGDPLTVVLDTGPVSGTLTLYLDGSFQYTPDADFYGTDTFSYVAKDKFLPSNIATVTITVDPVNDVPVAVNDGYTTDEDVTLNVVAPGVLVNDTDVENDSLSAVLDTGPISGTLTLNSDGSFQYTPDADFYGTDTFSYVANDGSVDSNIATVTITVDPVNDAPVAVDNAYTTDEDVPLDIAAPGVLGNDTDVDGNPLTVVLDTGSISGTLTLNSDGSFQYTPNPNFYGTDTFSYLANDGFMDSNIATVTITVDPINDTPVALIDTYTTDEDVILNVVAPGVLENDYDVDGDPLTVSLVFDPNHGTVALNSDGSFQYTPDADFYGTDYFIYDANDGTADSNLASVTITVDPVNDGGPVAVNDDYTTDEDVTLNVVAPGVLANDTDVDGDPLKAILDTGPVSGTLTLYLNGSFQYTPDADFYGTDTFSYVAIDGFVASGVATVTITVDPVNDAPVAVNDGYTTDEDVTLNVVAPGVLSNDTDVDGNPLTAVLDTGPISGTLTLNSDGSFQYTPDANFYGTDTFSYVANDGSVDSNIATVTITVDPVNDPPVAVDDSYTTNKNTSLNVAIPGVLGNDTDPEGDTLTASLETYPSNGLLTFHSDGSFEYIPNYGFIGTDSFTYIANDGTDDSNTATVTIVTNYKVYIPIIVTK